MDIVNRCPGTTAHVALETTLLVHGVPRGQGAALAADLSRLIRERGAEPAVIGVVAGRATVGMSEAELGALLGAAAVPKVNTANLGVVLHRGGHGATSVSATLEIASAAGIRVLATGGIGGVHRGYGARLDISGDLAALARYPVAVVCSGVKSLLDVESTREALEALGVPVVGYRTDRFAAFYRRVSGAGVDARFDAPADLSRFVKAELGRTGRGILIANPIPEPAEISGADWDRWFAKAEAAALEAGAAGRDLTPRILSHLHEVSGGATLRANIALVKANAALAADLARLLV